ncbi:carbohydrate ABC transporter permease [Lachnoclostridium phytofermentans]|nr:carbohydrate ABC transporter permease [Lachnoclostridium phytofermentans]
MKKSMYKKKIIKKLITTIVLGLFILTMLFPLLWMLSTSFKLEIDVFNFPIEWIPPKFTLNNYIKIWRGNYNFPLYYWNTIKVTVLVVLIQIVISSMAAYAFAKLDFKFKNLLFSIFLATMMIPDQVTLVPRFMLLTKMQLLNSHFGLILMLSFSVYGVFLLRQSMIALPDTIIEAAKIDGANHFIIFIRIVLPMTKSIIATLAILRFVWTWNDYQNPLIFLRDSKLFTLQLGMQQFASVSGTFYSLLMAASVCAIVPLLLVFIIGQNYVIEGIASGAVKG